MGCQVNLFSKSNIVKIIKLYLQRLSFSSVPPRKYSMKHKLASQSISTGAEHIHLPRCISLYFLVKLCMEFWSSLFQQGFAKRPYTKLQICANAVDDNIRLQQNHNKNIYNQERSGRPLPVNAEPSNAEQRLGCDSPPLKQMPVSGQVKQTQPLHSALSPLPRAKSFRHFLVDELRLHCSFCSITTRCTYRIKHM